MNKRRNDARRESWKEDVEFHVPCAEPGITFKVVLHLEGTRPRRMPAPRAIAIARGAAVEAIAETAKRYSVAADKAATDAAEAACLNLKRSRRKPHIDTVRVRLHGDRDAKVELRHLQTLKRIAEVAGAEAVTEAARAVAIRHTVLDDHGTTVARLLLEPPAKTEFDNLPETAAELRTGIDDYRPDERWIRVAETLKAFADKRATEEVKQVLRDLSVWIASRSPELSERIDEARREAPLDGDLPSQDPDLQTAENE